MFACFSLAIVIALSSMTKGSASDNTLLNLENSTLNDDSLRYISEYPIAKTCLLSTNNNWRPTKLILKSIDSKLKALCSQRCLYFMQLYDSNPATRASVLDTGIQPKSLSEVAAYVPRAAVVGLLSPFPSSWFQKNNGRFSTLYCMVAVETMLFYLSLSGLLYLLISDVRPLLLVPISLATAVLVVYGLSVPFLGALYRYRYPFWMLLLCMGLGMLLTELSQKKDPRFRQILM